VLFFYLQSTASTLSIEVIVVGIVVILYVLLDLNYSLIQLCNFLFIVLYIFFKRLNLFVQTLFRLHILQLKFVFKCFNSSFYSLRDELFFKFFYLFL
jgi:hypothetical protein